MNIHIRDVHIHAMNVQGFGFEVSIGLILGGAKFRLFTDTVQGTKTFLWVNRAANLRAPARIHMRTYLICLYT